MEGLACMDTPILEFNSSFKGAEFYTEYISENYPAVMARKVIKHKQIPDWARRLQVRLKELGWSVAELARRMGRGDDPVFLDKLYKYVRGDVKQPRGELLEEIAQAVGMRGPDLRYGDLSMPGGPTDNVRRLGEAAHVRTLGEVAAGVFKDITHADQANFEDDSVGLPIPADPRVPINAQYDLIVRGTSINRFAPDGYRLRIVDTETTGRTPEYNEFVIVQRSRDGGQTIETTAKRYVSRGAKVELWPDSDDERWQTPLAYGEHEPDRETVKIVGIVLYAYQTSRARR